MKAEDESKDSILDSQDSEEEQNLGIDILTLMRNMIDNEENMKEKIEIFDDNSHSIHPTFWTNTSQLATCRKCGKTGESLIKKRCGIGNWCCTCCLCLVCLWPCIPFMCFFVCDRHHYCSSCQEIMGIKTFI